MEFKKGEIYTGQINEEHFIFVYEKPKYFSNYLHYLKNNTGEIKNISFKNIINDHGWEIHTRESTLEEKHWILCCIKLGKQISLEEAMKSFNSPPIYEIY